MAPGDVEASTEAKDLGKRKGDGVKVVEDDDGDCR
jgi:hypothetical protein